MHSIANAAKILSVYERISIDEARCITIDADTDVIGRTITFERLLCLVLPFSGFTKRSLSWSKQTHPRDLEMVTAMMDAHFWIAAKISLF